MKTLSDMFRYEKSAPQIRCSSSPDPLPIWFSGSERGGRGEGRAWQGEAEEEETGWAAQRWRTECPRVSHNQLSVHLQRWIQLKSGRTRRESPWGLGSNLKTEIKQTYELQIFFLAVTFHFMTGRPFLSVFTQIMINILFIYKYILLLKLHSGWQEVGSASKMSKKTLHNINKHKIVCPYLIIQLALDA